MTPSWEHFHHDADIGVRGRGPSPQIAFEQAALALTAIVAPPEKVREELEVEFQCEAPTLDLLFMDFLNALIYEMSTRKVLFCRFELEISGLRLRARVIGETVDRRRHQPVVEPKGATLTSLRVRRDEEADWIAQCVVDV